MCILQHGDQYDSYGTSLGCGGCDGAAQLVDASVLSEKESLEIPVSGYLSQCRIYDSFLSACGSAAVSVSCGGAGWQRLRLSGMRKKDEQQWVRALCEEAFDTLQLLSIYALVEKRNTASIHVLEANGFQREEFGKLYMFKKYK